MRRPSILASIATALFALLLSTAVAPAPAVALPAGALARVASATDAGRSGYGSPEPCVCRGYAYSAWATPDRYVVAGGGAGLRVARIGGSTLRVSELTTARPYRRRASRRVTFPGWQIGGVLPAPDGSWYVLVGRPNPNQDNTRSVIEVHRLDSALRETGMAQVFGGFDEHGIYQPFEATASSMAFAGSTLVVHTARLIYHIAGDEAPHHQVNLTFAVDTATMTARPAVPAPYASHSFRQFVRVQDADDAVYLDHGDAYPRSLQLAVTGDVFATPPVVCPEDDDLQHLTCLSGLRGLQVDLWTFDGATGDNETGTTVNGFEVGQSHALTVGLSVPHDHPVQGVSGSSPRLNPNAYLIATDTTTGTSSFRWLTTYRPQGTATAVGQPRLVPLTDGRFVLLFATMDRRRLTLQYRLIDEQGTVLASRSWPQRRFVPVAQPAAVGTSIFWIGYAPRMSRDTSGGGDYMYALDVADPTHPTIVGR